MTAGEYGSPPASGQYGPPPGHSAAASVLALLMLAGAILVLGVALVFALRWAMTEYYIATHCTVVLGTRVCQ
jgi:hypothetical protein